MIQMNKRYRLEMFKNAIRKMVGTTLTVGLLISNAVPAFAQDAANGKNLFEGNCTSCHGVHEKLIGPALSGVSDRREEAWLLKWINNSQGMIKAGDPIAVKLFNDNGKQSMNSFNFSDAELKDILAYIKEETAKGPATASAAPAGGEVSSMSVANNTQGMDNDQTMMILGVLAVILVLSSILLWRINGVLQKLIWAKFPEKKEEEEPSWYNTKFIPWVRGLNPTIAIMVIVTGFGLAFGGWFFKYANTEIGVQQGYAPTQPINFSHELHAGQMKIDCQYCHSTADVSKQASVPPVSTCMNCHNFFKQDSPEIQKLKTAYETKQPIKWVRIHNLPDHAYFNHSQHVSVGKVECQTCHGPIETMAKVSQHASLQMGWCVNCHRESKVDVENNDYYEQLHADLKERGKRSISVAHNGGLECGKCHY
ncbi:MAG: c-type cytochrome [Bacteroidetes bacterium]|nr:MAG: c-type cytochrome [Bacteroidota bacterium]